MTKNSGDEDFPSYFDQQGQPAPWQESGPSSQPNGSPSAGEFGAAEEQNPWPVYDPSAGQGPGPAQTDYSDAYEYGRSESEHYSNPDPYGRAEYGGTDPYGSTDPYSSSPYGGSQDTSPYHSPYNSLARSNASKPPKNMVLAVVLAAVFGPLGVFYTNAKIAGGLIGAFIIAGIADLDIGGALWALGIVVNVVLTHRRNKGD